MIRAEWIPVIALVLPAAAFGIGAACSASRNGGNGPAAGNDPHTGRRDVMVATQIESRGIRDSLVLAALRRVPRHRFVPEELIDRAHSDGPLPIGYGQTISQPYIVALMTELLRPDRSKRILEIGTGSGYQAAVLAECFGEIYTIEIVPELGRRAASILDALGYRDVRVRIGDGYDGWPEEAPFDGVMLTAAPDEIPEPLLEQLADGGVLVAPVGVGVQDLVVVTRHGDSFERRVVTGVRFVPMTGKAQHD